MQQIERRKAVQNGQEYNLFNPTCSISPEKEKNSLISCSEAPKETLLTFTVLTCHCELYRKWKTTQKGERMELHAEKIAMTTRVTLRKR